MPVVEENEKSIAKRLMWQVEKHSASLEQLPIEEHGAVMQILSQLFNARAVEFQKAQQADREAEIAAQKEAAAALEREKHFGLTRQ